MARNLEATRRTHARIKRPEPHAMDTDSERMRVRRKLLLSIVPFGWVNVAALIVSPLALATASDGRVAPGALRWWVAAVWLGAVLQLVLLAARSAVWERWPFRWEQVYGVLEAYVGASWSSALALEVVRGEPFTFHLLAVCFLLMTNAAGVIAFAGSSHIGRRFLGGQWATALAMALFLGSWQIAILAALVWTVSTVYLTFSCRMLRQSVVERDRVTELSRDLAVQASTDSLTMLRNRNATLQAIQQQLDLGRQVSVLFIDLDRFKAINDRFGHAMGDTVLASVANRLRAVARAGDIVGRLGGDEFVVVLTDPVDQRHLDKIASRFAAEISSCHGVAPELAVTASIGSTVSIEGASAEDLLGFADVAMYQAKARGGDGAVNFAHN